MTQPDAVQPANPPPKASYFCPHCGSCGSIERDLRLCETSDRRAYCCPNCGTELTRRPDSPPTDPDSREDRLVLEAD